MKRLLTNIFLPGISIASLLTSIVEVSLDNGWFFFFLLVASLLLGGGVVLLFKGLAKKLLPWLSIAFGAAIFITAIGTHNDQKDNILRNELWSDELRNRTEQGVAMKPLEKSAILDNDALSQFHLAENYLYGNDEYDSDFEKAKDFAQKSADQGNPRAHALLARIYSQGYGVEPDYQSAFSNIILSLKGGDEQSLSLLSLLDSADFRVSSKDSLVLNECVRNTTFLDSLYSVVSITFHTKGFPACFPIIRKHKERCRELSDAGYSRAAELLYSEVWGDPNRQQEQQQYTQILFANDRIPDLPLMRSMFFQAMRGGQQPASEKEFVERAIKNRDFWGSLDYVDFDKRNIHDLTYRYEYDRAFYERSKYLLTNQKELDSLYFQIDESNHISLMRQNAKISLSDCTEEIRRMMHNRPTVFAAK